MAFRRTYAQDEEVVDPVVRDDSYDAVEERPVASYTAWSPAQLFALITGIDMTVLGIAAVARTGFDTSHIYRPHDLVWRLPHSPLLAVCEIGFGVLMIVAAVVPGGLRPLMALLGAVSLAFGIVILTNASSDNLVRWFAVTHRSGWFFTIVGAVTVLAAILSPVFYTGSRRRHVRRVQTMA